MVKFEIQPIGSFTDPSPSLCLFRARTGTGGVGAGGGLEGGGGLGGDMTDGQDNANIS